MEGTQLLAVYDVALGSCLDLYEQDYLLNNAPSAYDSVHGVRKTADISLDFEGDEFVVYKSCQVKIRYVVKFCLAEDQIKPFQPAIGMELEQDNNEPFTMLFTARELCKCKSFKSCKNWSSGQIGKSCPSERCLYQGKDNRLCSTDLLFVDLKLLSMENMSLERMALGISAHDWEKILRFDVDCFINNFLIRKGIQSLGPNGKEKLLQLVAALVLQFMHCTKKLKGIVFKRLIKLDFSSNSSGVHWAIELVKKAIKRVRIVERRFPSVC